MTALTPDRAAFAPVLGGHNARPAAARSLREAQAAFFRPAQAPVETPQPAVAKSQVVEQAEMPMDRSLLRPGSLLDIRV